MPSYTAGDLEACLANKLGGRERSGGNHRIFEIYDDAGNFVTSIPFSRGWRGSTSLGPSMVSVIKRQLLLQTRTKEFDDLVHCRLSRLDYLRLVGATARTS